MLSRFWRLLLFPWTIFGISLSRSQSIERGVAASYAATVNVSGFADNCFDSSFASRMVVPDYQDCVNATQEILDQAKDVNAQRTFRRAQGAMFMLPWVARNSTCVVSLDVANDDDWDRFTPWKAYTAALSLANVCVRDHSGLGGKLTIGPRNVVTLMLFGRESPALESSNDFEGLLLNDSASREAMLTAAASNSAVAIAADERGPLKPGMINASIPKVSSSVSHTLDGSGISIINSTSTRMDESSTEENAGLGGVAECYDPPMQRERLYPIRFTDCERAAAQIIGHRNKLDPYVFSRHVVEDPFYYPLPATFTYGKCVVVLDMENDHDVKRISVGGVELSAWVLAHKCSGEVQPHFRYGGTKTVGVGVTDLIRIFVYGRLLGTSGPEPVLSLSQSRTSIADQ